MKRFRVLILNNQLLRIPLRETIIKELILIYKKTTKNQEIKKVKIKEKSTFSLSNRILIRISNAGIKNKMKMKTFLIYSLKFAQKVEICIPKKFRKRLIYLKIVVFKRKIIYNKFRLIQRNQTQAKNECFPKIIS